MQMKSSGPTGDRFRASTSCCISLSKPTMKSTIRRSISTSEPCPLKPQGGAKSKFRKPISKNIKKLKHCPGSGNSPYSNPLASRTMHSYAFKPVFPTRFGGSKMSWSRPPRDRTGGQISMHAFGADMDDMISHQHRILT